MLCTIARRYMYIEIQASTHITALGTYLTDSVTMYTGYMPRIHIGISMGRKRMPCVNVVGFAAELKQR